jgi:hypothetical protein
MKITKKLLTNLLKIMKINGFHIIVGGENPTTFNFEGSFYFDNNKELENFRTDLAILIQNHTGGKALVETFEERDKRVEEWLSQK